MEAKSFSKEINHDPVQLLQDERRDAHASIVFEILIVPSLSLIIGTNYVLWKILIG